MAAFAALPAHAQVEMGSVEPQVHAERFAVSVNGADVSGGSTLYLASDGTVYASAKDLAAWHLEYPRDPSFERDGVGYYALQSVLNLAVAVDRPQERLQIVAPRSAFIGEPNDQREPVTSGGGTVMNYRLRRTDGNYDLFFTHDASTLQVRYDSTQSSHGIAFERAQTRWYHLDLEHHRVWQLGDSDINGGSIGTSVPFAGLHVASEFSKDPLFTPHELPSVRGVADSPSLVEVYVNNVLQWREEVPAGPFTVRDLPSSAAYGDVTLVLTDRQGRRTVQVVRPGVDQEYLRPGLTSYSLDAGLGRINGWEGGSYYRGGVVSALVRRGVTRTVTAQLQAQSIAGNTFLSLGAQMRIGAGSANIAYGEGRLRKAGEVDYRVRTGKFEFSERLRYNNESAATEYDPFGYYARFNESADVRYSSGGPLSLAIRLDRGVSNSGPPSAMLSLDSSYRLGNFDVSFRPLYDRANHQFSASLDITHRLGDIHSITERVDAPAGSPAQLALDYRKSQRDPSDPWSVEARTATGPTEERRLFLEDRMPWANASVLAQDQNGRGLIEPVLSGSLAAVGGKVYALRNLSGEESIGIVHLPSLPNVRIQLNGSDAGTTDKNGVLVLRNLSALQKNVVTADVSSIPLDEDVKDPEKIVPYAGTPVDLQMLRPQAQSVVLALVDASGSPLAPGSWFTADDGSRFPVGFDGRAFVHGMTPGRHRFTAASGCAFEVTIAPRWQIRDAGRVVCR